jgi:hypothetical protein
MVDIKDDIQAALSTYAKAREVLIAERQAALDTIRQIDEALAAMASDSVPSSSIPQQVVAKRNGRIKPPPVVDTPAVAPVALATGSEVTEAVKRFLQMASNASTSEVYDGVTKLLGRPPEKKNIYNVLAYLKRTGVLKSIGGRGSSRYRLA